MTPEAALCVTRDSSDGMVVVGSRGVGSQAARAQTLLKTVRPGW